MPTLYFTFLLLIYSFVIVSASDYTYKQSVDAATEAQLIAAGDKVLEDIKAGKPFDPRIQAFNIIASNPQKKGLLDKLKGKDLTLTLTGKAGKGSEEERQLRREYLAQVIALFWKIYDLGRKQGEVAESAAYVLLDPGRKVYSFLKSYVDMASKQSPSFAYDRDPKKNKSSHFKPFSPLSQWGIDMRFSGDQAALKLLPYGKQHMLFGALEYYKTHPEIFFWKIEYYGIASPSETVAHGIQFLKAQFRSSKDKANSRVEKVIRSNVVQAYLDTVEKLPAAVQTKFKTDSPDTVRDIIFKAKELKKAGVMSETQYRNLMDAVKVSYPKDNEIALALRQGSEIIIDLGS